MNKTILVTGGAGFKSAGRLARLSSSQCRSSDINFDDHTLLIKILGS